MGRSQRGVVLNVHPLIHSLHHTICSTEHEQYSRKSWVRKSLLGVETDQAKRGVGDPQGRENSTSESLGSSAGISGGLGIKTQTGEREETSEVE